MSIKEDYIAYISNSNNIRKIPTGISKLDNIYGGGLPTGFTIIGAETGLGKTTFTLQLADTIAKEENVKVLFFSLELSKYELLSKTLSRISYFDNELPNHTPNEFISNEVEDIDNYFNKYEEIQDNIFLIDNVKDIGGIIGNTIAFCKKYANDKVVVVIDYLQYIKCEGNSDKQNIDNITRELKNITSKYNVSIIAISSLSRDGGKRNDLTSFKESGSIEYTADYVIILKKKVVEKGLAFDNEDNIITLEFLKHRFGSKDSFDMKYFGNFATFIQN